MSRLAPSRPSAVVLALALAAVLSVVGLATTTARTLAMDPEYRREEWVATAFTWIVGAFLYAVAALRFPSRTTEARILSIVAAIVVAPVTIDYVGAGGEALLIARRLICSLAPWLAIAYRPRLWKILLAVPNVLVVVAATAYALWAPRNMGSLVALGLISWPWLLVSLPPVLWNVFEPTVPVVALLGGALGVYVALRRPARPTP